MNFERMVKNFIDMTQILSPSTKEDKLINYLLKKFKRYTSKVIIDKNKNLIIKINSSYSSSPILLSAHLDTVNTLTKPKIIMNEKIIKTKNNVILGADCKAGIAIILEIVENIFEKNLPFPPLEIILTSQEELGLSGSSKINKRLIKAKYGVVLDNEKDINFPINEAVGVDHFELIIYGKQVHSGVSIENGISAIKIAAEIISKIPSGKLSSNTTLNIAFVEGGEGINIVPGICKIKGEIRSFSKKEIKFFKKKIKDISNRITRKYGAKYEMKAMTKFEPFYITLNSKIAEIVRKAYEKNNLKPIFVKSFGGTDANNFSKMGIEVLNIPTGMKKVHSPKEYLDLNEFKKSYMIIMEVIKNAI